MKKQHNKEKIYSLSALSFILLVSTAFLTIERAHVKGKNKELEILKESNTEVIASLQDDISNLEMDRKSLQDQLEEERRINEDFFDQIKDISGEVKILDKIAKTDEELLQKYSKVYFLNEHYVPSSLTNIEEKYLADENKPLQFHGDAYPYLEDLLEEAEDDGMSLRIRSAFRSFGTQSALKERYAVTYGAGTANQFSADQGYSEHQLGTTIDFTTPETNGNFDAFSSTEEYEWLLKNAYKYGFVLSYPEGNTYYQFEPWHWRFVGEDLADYLNDRDINFYDADQRKIDEYIPNLFD